MFRTSIFTSAFLAMALGIAAMGSAAAPASAFSSQVFSGRNEQIFAHYHPVTSVGVSRYRFPGKKKS
jgi:hypothetical protein